MIEQEKQHKSLPNEGCTPVMERVADGSTETERLPRLIKLFEELEGAFI